VGIKTSLVAFARERHRKAEESGLVRRRYDGVQLLGEAKILLVQAHLCQKRQLVEGVSRRAMAVDGGPGFFSYFPDKCFRLRKSKYCVPGFTDRTTAGQGIVQER
jgi:hypothetical protein